MLRYIAFSIVGAALTAHATVTSYSPPIGGMTITVPAGQTRSVALPLLHESIGTGAMRGRITAVGANYIDVSGANWSPGGLSTAANPYYLRIRSGAARGRVMLVSSRANTVSRLNVNNDGIDLQQSNISAGDEYELVLADNLESLFGSDSLQGGPNAASADNVMVFGGASWLIFYYNTDRDRWERNIDTAAHPSRDTYLLRPDRGMMITRNASTELKLRITGRVPLKAPRYAHATPGITFLSHGLPTRMTLGDLSLQTRAQGWKGGASGATSTVDADLIQVWGGASWLIFYYNTVNQRWQRNLDTDTSPSRDIYAIPAGRPIMIRRLASASSSTDRLIDIPMTYTVEM